DARDGWRLASALFRPAAKRLEGHPTLLRDLDPPLERAFGIGHGARHVLVARVHPELAARRLDHGRGEPVVVGVGVRAEHQAYVGGAPARLSKGALELRERG